MIKKHNNFKMMTVFLSLMNIILLASLLFFFYGIKKTLTKNDGSSVDKLNENVTELISVFQQESNNLNQIGEKISDKLNLNEISENFKRELGKGISEVSEGIKQGTDEIHVFLEGIKKLFSACFVCGKFNVKLETTGQGLLSGISANIISNNEKIISKNKLIEFIKNKIIIIHGNIESVSYERRSVVNQTGRKVVNKKTIELDSNHESFSSMLEKLKKMKEKNEDYTLNEKREEFTFKNIECRDCNQILKIEEDFSIKDL